MNSELVREAERKLQKLDPILGELIKSQTLKPRTVRSEYFSALCRSIIGQQVSVAAAAAIFSRFENLTKLSPSTVVEMSEEVIREVGLSRQKALYLKDLAKHFVDDPNVYNHLERQPDEQVIAELTVVKGIGVWTAQMFLMFTLARQDVFAPDDAGLQRAMMKLYKWETLPPLKELKQIASAWSPYRTIASFHLWQSLDNSPV